jgi:hypothetical protein
LKTANHSPRVTGNRLPVPPLLMFCGVCLLFTRTADARTIVLTDQDCERIACISADAPRLGFAGTQSAPGDFGNYYVDLTPKQSFLIRYPLDKIPPGQRITKAEWIVPIIQAYPATGVRMQARRLLADWGPGVSHQFRMTRPARVEWKSPGAKAGGVDRAAEPTATAIAHNSGEVTMNVTEDVELWYGGAAVNNGWILTADDAEQFLRMSSPFWGSPKGWKLRITFEPE